MPPSLEGYLEDVAFLPNRVLRAETIAAEDVLHNTGAISIMSSDLHKQWDASGSRFASLEHGHHKNNVSSRCITGRYGTDATTMSTEIHQ